MRRAALAVAFFSVLLSAVPAQAVPPILRPGTRPWWASLQMGGAILARPRVSEVCTPFFGCVGGAGWLDQFKLVEEIGYHFSGNASGPAIAFDLQESFNGPVFFEMGPKFVWDIPIIQDLGLYLSPSGMIGYAYIEGGTHKFDLQIGFEGKLMLADRAYVFFRPFTLDFLISDDLILRYDIMFGGGVTF